MNTRMMKMSAVAALVASMALAGSSKTGRVALKGTAPSTAAREQATTLAQNVKGVVSVDNQLTVQQ